MKYIKEYKNIDFDEFDWEEEEGNKINFSYKNKDEWKEFINNISVGDRVICNFNNTNDNYINELAYVREITKDEILLEFDNYIGGHDGMSTGSIYRGKNGHCWWFNYNFLYELEISKID
jgi:hypothetical protein